MALFVNLEAVDRAGKSTQLAAVASALRGRGLRVAVFAFPNRPSTSPLPHPSHRATGVLMDRYLREEVSFVHLSDTLFHRLGDCLDADFAAAYGDLPRPALSERTKEVLRGLVEEKLYQVVNSVNRREHLEELEAALADPGTDVVLAVRLQSAWAYGVAKGVSPVQLRALEGDLPSPDLTVLLEVDPAVARARRGDDAPDRYEADGDYQATVRARYRELAREDADASRAEGRPPRYARVDAAEGPEAVCGAITALVLARLGR